MKREMIEAMQLEAQQALTMGDLADLSGLAESMLRELVEDGALHPIDSAASRWTFKGECVVLARTASRLQRELDLDAHALAIVMRFIERVHALECEVRKLRARVGA